MGANSSCTEVMLPAGKNAIRPGSSSSDVGSERSSEASTLRLGLPDPAIVRHVTVEQYLELAELLKGSAADRQKLAAELQVLRRQLQEASGAHSRISQRHANESRDRREAEAQRDRHANRASKLRKSMAAVKDSEEALKVELTQVKASESRLQKMLDQHKDQLSKLRLEHQKLVNLLALQRKQMQVLGTLSCPQCALKAREIGAVRDFFQEARQR
ncbi:unnamed protein product [Symbiodinium pilosum]|uniref:Uncharacterized protein n=1 Tax=Symbiodinium pilosum TaxID=2952 RepID=A0A812S4Q9_SYMPI|nr:unnamed protein product [Symbiodinium pilosum]